MISRILIALLAALGASNLSAAESCVAEYIQYSLYPDFHSNWPGGTMRFDFLSHRLSMNDVGDKISLDYIDGWHVVRVHNHDLVFAAPRDRDSNQESELYGYHFSFNKVIKEIRVFGSSLSVQEIKAKSGGEEVLRLLIETGGGVRAILVPPDNEFGLTNWSFHASGVPLFDLSSLCYSN